MADIGSLIEEMRKRGFRVLNGGAIIYRKSFLGIIEGEGITVGDTANINSQLFELARKYGAKVKPCYSNGSYKKPNKKGRLHVL